MLYLLSLIMLLILLKHWSLRVLGRNVFKNLNEYTDFFDEDLMTNRIELWKKVSDSDSNNGILINQLLNVDLEILHV